MSILQRRLLNPPPDSLDKIAVRITDVQAVYRALCTCASDHPTSHKYWDAFRQQSFRDVLHWLRDDKAEITAACLNPGRFRLDFVALKMHVDLLRAEQEAMARCRVG